MTVATTPPPSSRRLRCQDRAITAISWSPSMTCAVLVGDDHPVGVAIERDADIGADFTHLLAHRPGAVEPHFSLMLKPLARSPIATISAPSSHSAAGATL